MLRAIWQESKFPLMGMVLCVFALIALVMVCWSVEPLEAQSVFNAGRVTVATTATAVYTAPARGATVLLCNRHSASIFIGPSTVTTANGFEVAAGDCTQQTPYARATIYGIVAAATARVDYTEGSYPR
jgi:hypothetical protein